MSEEIKNEKKDIDDISFEDFMELIVDDLFKASASLTKRAEKNTQSIWTFADQHIKDEKLNNELKEISSHNIFDTDNINQEILNSTYTLYDIFVKPNKDKKESNPTENK